jgi:ribose-phosphate pyrophosphokinase
MEYIVVGPDSFAENIAKELGAKFVRLDKRVFPDREVCPRVMATSAELKGKKVILVNRTWSCERFNPNAYMMEFYLAVLNLKSMGAKEISIVLPYYAYAMQDKVFREGEPLSGRYVLEIFKALGVRRVFTVSSHMQREEGKLRYYKGLEVHNISGFPVIGEHIKAKYGWGKGTVVVGPDFTADSDVRLVASVLGMEETTSIRKERDLDTGETRIREGDLKNLAGGKRVLIVDDIAETGGTLVKAIELCKGKGAKEIMCAVVHPVLAGECYQKVTKTGAKFIAGNTIDSPISEVRLEKRIAGFVQKRLLTS